MKLLSEVQEHVSVESKKDDCFQIQYIISFSRRDREGLVPINGCQLLWLSGYQETC